MARAESADGPVFGIPSGISVGTPAPPPPVVQTSGPTTTGPVTGGLPTDPLTFLQGLPVIGKILTPGVGYSKSDPWAKGSRLEGASGQWKDGWQDRCSEPDCGNHAWTPKAGDYSQCGDPDTQLSRTDPVQGGVFLLGVAGYKSSLDHYAREFGWTPDTEQKLMDLRAQVIKANVASTCTEGPPGYQFLLPVVGYQDPGWMIGILAVLGALTGGAVAAGIGVAAGGAVAAGAVLSGAATGVSIGTKLGSIGSQISNPPPTSAPPGSVPVIQAQLPPQPPPPSTGPTSSLNGLAGSSLLILAAGALLLGGILDGD